MNNKSAWKTRVLLMVQACLISSLFFPSVAFAYVDPGSGSVIVTTVLGLIAAVGYTFRKYFYKIKRIITKTRTEEEQQNSE